MRLACLPQLPELPVGEPQTRSTGHSVHESRGRELIGSIDRSIQPLRAGRESPSSHLPNLFSEVELSNEPNRIQHLSPPPNLIVRPVRSHVRR